MKTSECVTRALTRAISLPATRKQTLGGHHLETMRLPRVASTVLAAASTLFDSPRTIQVVGDVYLDILAKVDELPEWDGDTSIKSPIETLAGGSALNTAVQLSALLNNDDEPRRRRKSRRCTLHSRIGTDLYGDLVASRIRESGVRLSAQRAGSQGVCICLSGQHDRSFVSYKGSVAEFTEADLNMATLLARDTRHVHFSAFYDCAGLQPSVPRLMERAKAECGATISIVPQSDSAGEWRGGMIELLPHIDVLLCNQREAAAIAGVEFSARRPTWSQLDESVRRLQAAGAPLVVVTLGAGGAIAASDSGWWFQPASPREVVVDTTGCGDAFAAGFLYGWCGSGDVQRGLTYGCACGTAAVEMMGGATPLDEDSIAACMRRQDGALTASDVTSFDELMRMTV